MHSGVKVFFCGIPKLLNSSGSAASRAAAGKKKKKEGKLFPELLLEHVSTVVNYAISYQIHVKTFEKRNTETSKTDRRNDEGDSWSAPDKPEGRQSC